VEVSPQGRGPSLLRDWNAGRRERRKVPTGTCPECEADVHVDTDADKGDMVSCEECGTDLEIVGLDPVELDIVEDDEDEDEDDEDEF
jgi:alpha-aminoadipate carrier protein LysW